MGRPVIYVDESGFAHDMPRTHGYGPKDKRCYGERDWHTLGRTNVIGAMFGGILIAISLFNCYTDSNVFHAWITQDLIAKLPSKAVIVMDNATFHKRNDTNAMTQK